MAQLLADPEGEATDYPVFPSNLGQYEIRRLVGRGGTGMVFEGFDPALKRRVAIKVLSPALAANEQSRSRFLREARAAAALTHEHVVPIHAVDQADGVPFLVLQYVAGESLADRLRRDGRLPLADVVRIGIQVARGLAAAHEQRLVHRDVKPGNLLLEAGTNQVKIADFGLAKTPGLDTLTLEGTIAGTPEFMSPEQASGGDVDARSDLFSLGTVLYLAATGISPFRADSALGTMERVCRASPTPLRQVEATLPEWFCAVVHRLLEKDPRDRIPSASQVAEALARGKVVRGRSRRRWVLAALALTVVLVGTVGPRFGRPDGSGIATSPLPTIGFVIAGRTQSFRDLAEAIREAGDGDVIEVYGDGPFPTPPLRIEGKRLTIRAAERAKPLFLPQAPGRRSTQPFVTTDADLRLEGLDLRWTHEPAQGESDAELLSRCALVSTRGSLALTHCRIVAGKRNGCVGGGGAQVILRNSHLVAGSGACVFWRPSSGGSVSVEGCVLEGQIGVSVLAVAETAQPAPATLSLTHNTIVGAKALQLRVGLRPKHPLRVTARHNILDNSQLVLIRPLRPLRRPDKSPTEVTRLFRSFVTWSDEANTYRRGMDYVAAAEGPRLPVTLSAGIHKLEQWLRVWEAPAKQSVEGVIKLRERSEDTKLQPAQLAGIDNATGPVPSGVGANADAVGPGSPYQAWRTAPGQGR